LKSRKGSGSNRGYHFYIGKTGFRMESIVFVVIPM
jgi:hypothetical protein